MLGLGGQGHGSQADLAGPASNRVHTDRLPGRQRKRETLEEERARIGNIQEKERREEDSSERTVREFWAICGLRNWESYV